MILKILFTEQIEAIAADASQDRVPNSGCKSAVREIEKRPEQSHQ